MTSEPRHEVEVQGRAGEPVALPVGHEPDAEHRWSLELPPEVEAVDAAAPVDADQTVGPRLHVRADRPGSYVLTATLADVRTGVAMTVLPIRVTVV